MNNFGKNLALWIVIGLLLVALFNLFQTSSSRGPQATLAFSDFLNDVNRGQVADVTIQGNACDPNEITVPAGRTTFTIVNKSNRALEWEILDGVMVVEERENIAPGFVRSNPTTERQWESYGEAGQRELVDRIALKRLGTPDDIAHAVLFFASDYAGWITGQVLSVDGGR